MGGHGRTVGDAYRGDELMNVALVRAGLAWHYVKYAPDNDTLRDAERNARSEASGFWKDPRHVAPLPLPLLSWQAP